MTDLELDDELQRQLRRWGDDLARLVPPYRHAPTPARLAPATQRRPLWLVAAVVATVVVGAGALWRAQTDSTSRVATQGGAAMVRHERIEVRISANLSCAPIDASATFDHATVDTWADTEGRRYRTRVTYPDGSNYDVIAIGSPYYPTELYERGQARLGPLGCDGEAGFSERGTGVGAIYSLNALAETPRDANGDPLVLGLINSTTPVAGAYADSLGRPAVLREEVITGGYSGHGLSSAPIVQTTRVFVDPASGEINESTYTNEIEGLGRLDRIATRTLTATGPATDDLYDHDGYARQPVRSPPTDSGPAPTTPQRNPSTSTI